MKAQVSADFLITLTVAMALFLFLFVIIADRNTDFNEKKIQLEAKKIADRFATEIYAVSIAGPGTVKTIILPNTLKGEIPYVINLYANASLVEILWQTDETKRYAVPLLSYTGQSLSNITDDITATNDIDIIFNASQSSFDCHSFCVGLSYGSGTCRNGASECVAQGEMHENKGNALCIQETGGVCCCG